MNVLITGASGLLGTDIALELASSSEHKIIKNSLSERTGFISADISQKSGTEKLASIDWDCIIHTSASRDPDSCEKDKEGTFNLNVRASEELAKIASAKNAKFVFISTDYCFSGNNPPYRETDIPDPINYYGETKLQAEKLISSICPDALILRVPILYGINAGLKASALLYSSVKAIESQNKIFIDDVIARYPVYTGDVARAIGFLLKKEASGTFHFSSSDKLTKYLIAKEIADIIGKDSSHIKPLKTLSASPAQRPLDSHLNTDKLFSLGFSFPCPFKARIAEFFRMKKL